MTPEAESLRRILEAIGPIEWQDGHMRKRLTWRAYGFIFECQYNDGLEDLNWYHDRLCEYAIARALILEAAAKRLGLLPSAEVAEELLSLKAAALAHESDTW